MKNPRIRRHHPRRGFSLVELAVTIAVVGVLAAVVFPQFDRVKRKGELNEVARIALADLRQARALSASGKLIAEPSSTVGGGTGGSAGSGGSPPNSISAPSTPTPGGTEIRAKSGGIRIASTTSYIVFADEDLASGGEVDIAAVDFTARHAGSHVRIIDPAPGTEIRFQSNGTRAIGPNQIVLEDETTGDRRTIVITGAGSAKFL